MFPVNIRESVMCLFFFLTTVKLCYFYEHLMRSNIYAGFYYSGIAMATIEVESFFYDLIHCKDKILATFDEWDEKYEDDERGALVAGIRECKEADLINILINIQRLASGYEQIKELMDAAEQKEVDEAMLDDEDDDD